MLVFKVFPGASILLKHKPLLYKVRCLTVTIISILMFWQEVFKGRIDRSTSNNYCVRMHVVCEFWYVFGVEMFSKLIFVNEVTSKAECSQGG